MEQLIVQVRGVKESGNALWGARRVRSAVRKYRKCVRYLEQESVKLLRFFKSKFFKEQLVFGSLGSILILFRKKKFLELLEISKLIQENDGRKASDTFLKM